MKKQIERFRKMFACIMAMVLGISGIISIDSHAEQTEGESAKNVESKTADTRAVLSISKDKVTFEKTEAFTYNIYANGMPLIVVASSVAGYSEIYVDLNENGIAETGEELTGYRGDDTDGMYYANGYGYWLANSVIYGGAKEGDYAYDTCIKVNGAGNDNNQYAVCGICGGSKSGTLTGNTDITVNGGTIRFIQPAGNGCSNVSVLLKDCKTEWLELTSPVLGNLDIEFYNSEAETFTILEDVLANAKDTALSYINCGSADKAWGEYDSLNPYILSNAENPVLSGTYWNHNRFKSITLKDSYMSFLDVSTWNEELGLAEAADKLILDGGALRIVGNQRANMPDTTFLNSPLLIRSSESEPICFAGAEIEGTARVQWLSADGRSIPENLARSIVDTDSDISNQTFAAAREGYGLKTKSVYYSGNQWWGKGWYTDEAKNICTCSLPYTGLMYNMFILPEGESEGEFILRDMLADNPGYENTCEMLEHQKTAPIVRYSLVEGSVDVESASIEDNRLTVSGLGTLSVRADRELNGKTDSYTAKVRIIRAPEDKEFTVVHEAEEDLTFNFEGWDVNQCIIYGYFDGSRVDITDDCIIEKGEGSFRFIIPKSYLADMELGEYRFFADIWGSMSYPYDFTIKIAEPKVVDNPIIEVIDEDIHYDGTAKEPQIIVRDGDTVIPESEYSVSYNNNIREGTATIIITDNDKGLYTVSGMSTFEIVNDFKPVNGKEYITNGLNENGWTNTDFVIAAQEGYLLSTGNTLSDEWVTGFTCTEETADGKQTFYVRNMENGRISIATSEEYKIDRDAPENYDFTLQGNSIKNEIGSETFWLILREAAEVGITAYDSLSGIGEIAYYASENPLNLQQLEQINEWILMNGDSLFIQPEDGKQLIIYGKIIDLAGNALYFGTEGIEFDITPPVIEGIEEEITYYTTRKVTVTDRNLAEITLNGAVISDNIVLLAGNTDMTYIIHAVDMAGNESTMTATMKPLSSLADDIVNLTEDNVTSANQEAVSNILQVVTDENTTEDELKAIEQFKEQAQKLQERIDKAYSAIHTDAVKEAYGISTENVQLTDKEKLLQAKADLESALEAYQGNYTEEEKLYIDEAISRIDASLDKITKLQEEPSAEFTVSKETEASTDNKIDESSKTGDSNKTYVWIMAMLGAVVWVLVDLCEKKRKLSK